MPKVTVIIPYFNRTQWLSEAVESVLGQTFKDFELIIINDGSTEYFELPPDPRVRQVYQENRGPAAARNLGMEMAEGEYVAFLDSDDHWVAAKLEKQVALMDAHPEVLLSHTSYNRIDTEGKVLETIHSGRLSGGLTEELVFNCTVATPTVMIRPQPALRFPESMRIGEDVILWYEFAARAAVMGIDEPLAECRIHGENACLSLEAQGTATRYFANYLIENNLPISHSVRCCLLLRLYDFHREPRYLLNALRAWPFEARIYSYALRHIVGSIRYNFSSP
jgi:glycosyltransferase involved in cell wall biosynthesis